MTDLCGFFMVGRVVKQPAEEEKNGLKRTVFSLAVNRDLKTKDGREEKVSFFDFAVFGKRAEFCGRWLAKGRAVSVRGHLVQDVWEKDGKKNSRVRLVADEINPFVEKKEKDGSGMTAPEPGDVVFDEESEQELFEDGSGGDIY